ncbi:hypothetical protein GCM10009780_77040 [Actinomadura alba]
MKTPTFVDTVNSASRPRAATNEPNLDGRTVEAIRGDGEWVVLGSAFLNRLRDDSAA